MLECWFVGNGSDDEPVKYPIPKIASIELVAEFIEIFLKELIFYAMIHSISAIEKASKSMVKPEFSLAQGTSTISMEPASVLSLGTRA
jgi:hypothetical protein